MISVLKTKMFLHERAWEGCNTNNEDMHDKGVKNKRKQNHAWEGCAKIKERQFCMRGVLKKKRKHNYE